MKITLQPSQFAFNPGSNIIDFSPMLGAFQPERLLAVIDTTTGKLVYAAASQPAGYGGTFSTTTYTNDTLTYASSNAGQSGSDILQILYDSETQSQNISASDGSQVLTTTDAMSLKEGLDVNLLNSSFGGQLGSPIPIPNNNNALSMAFLNGSVLSAPRMDPVTNELIVQSSPVALQAVDLTSVNSATISLGQNTMANSLPVTMASNQSAIPITTTSPIEVVVGQSVSQDILGVAVGGNRNNQIEVSFNTAPGATLITNTFTGAGSVSIANGHSIYQTGSVGAAASAQAVSVQTTIYRPAHEIYAAFTAAFTNMVVTRSDAKIGLFDATNGFFIGFNITSGFSVGVRSAGVDTIIPQGSWNTDLLNGGSTSKFTRNGTPETIDFALSNLFRIRFAWLGSANIYFEVFSPDAEWVLFHNIRQPNTNFNPSITSPNLPMTVLVSKIAGVQNSQVATACWGAGTTSAYSPITATLNDNTLAAMTRSVITGVTTGGGGGYVNVKVNPSGALVTDSTISGTAATNITQYGGTGTTLGQKAMTASMPVVLSSDHSIIDVEQPDLYTLGSINTAVGNNLFNNPAGPTGTDASGYKSASVQVIFTAAGGSIEFQHSSDNSTWVTIPVFRADSPTPAPITGAISAVISSNVYHFPIKMRYIRLNVTATLSGSPRANLRLSQDSWAPIVPTVVSATAGNLNATVAGALTSVGTITTVTGVTTVSTVSAITSANLSSASVADIANATQTTTQTSANISTLNTMAATFQVTTTATAFNAGTVLDVVVEETLDGTNYYTLYAFERISTTNAVVRSPVIKLAGTGIRYIRTISGGTPSSSIQNAVTRISRAGQAETIRRFINRTIDPNTLSSNTGSFFCDGVEDFNLIVRCTAQTTAATIALEFSTDGTNWFTSSATVTTVVGIVQAKVTNEQWKFVRATVTAAGTGITLGEVLIGGHSA